MNKSTAQKPLNSVQYSKHYTLHQVYIKQIVMALNVALFSLVQSLHPKLMKENQAFSVTNTTRVKGHEFGQLDTKIDDSVNYSVN